MLPITFDLAKYPTADTIRLLASLLERMTIANDLLNKQQPAQQQSQQRRASLQSSSPPGAPAYTRFHARLVPSIDIHSYLARILKYCPCANECFLSLLVYFDRMSKNSLALTGRPFTIDSFNIHRLIIAGVMVSSKFFSDVFYTNTRYAKVGGLPVSELNSLEIEFLKLNGFNLTVPISELQKYGDQLLKVGYMTQEMRKPSSFRHGRSSSFDQTRSDVDRVCDLTQRMSLDEQQHYGQHQNYYYHSQQPVPIKRSSYHHSNGNNNGHQIRRMTSTNSLKESGRYANHYYEQPRHSRSSVNLHQGFWKPSSPLPQQQQQQSSYDENTTSQPSRRLSITSIHAPPFIPSSELLAQQQQQQQQMQNIYYYPPMGIPTPPPSASPIHYQSPSANSSSTSVSYPIMYL
ncbi:PHO85 cyclin-7 [Choanephora cucurbitarum]|uniref:PHO85 cyclin-7 n=1 Tax=Choanephora cucurbitarum TaxID=101091 RepID=A0A1C7NL01_9FUNG|nr:PHO85 cyclin-7 [Choanephora cucurbitarum]